MRDSIPCWQKKLAEGFSTSTELLEFLQLPLSLANGFAEKQFKTRVPRDFAAKMIKGEPNDPLLRQVLAANEELEASEHVNDPLKEAAVIPMSGLIHKYHGRVLLTVTGACAINCRYCFRRHFPYQDNNPGRAGWGQVMTYIAKDPCIHEVILSGGDPLLATDRTLETLFEQLATIPHLRTIRIHTRIPIVLPARVNDHLSGILSASRLRKVVVLHCNHPQEIDAEVARACKALRQADCHLLNQSVLLKGVNDNAYILAALSERLFDEGVLPYYLHLLDKVRGAAHFDVALNDAIALFQELQNLLPGYLVPRLAREEPGKKSKTIIGTMLHESVP